MQTLDHFGPGECCDLCFVLFINNVVYSFWKQPDDQCYALIQQPHVGLSLMCLCASRGHYPLWIISLRRHVFKIISFFLSWLGSPLYITFSYKCWHSIYLSKLFIPALHHPKLHPRHMRWLQATTSDGSQPTENRTQQTRTRCSEADAGHFLWHTCLYTLSPFT